MALTVAAFLGVKQAELLLHQFQQPGTRSYGVAALGGGWPPRPEEAEAAVALWNGHGSATANEAAVFLVGYTAVDLVLIVCLVWLLSAVGRRVARANPLIMRRDLVLEWNDRLVWAEEGNVLNRLRPLGYFALFDVAEDVLRLGTYATGGEKTFYVLAFVAEKAKFVALLIVLLALLVGVREVRRQRVEWSWLQSHHRRALMVLRGQLALVVVFGALLLADVTGQVGDLFRRWTDTPSAGLWGGGSVILLAAALWLSARRTWARKRGGRLEVSSWVVLGALMATAGVAFVLWRSTEAGVGLALPLVLLVVLALDVLARLIKWRDPESAMHEAKEATREARDERGEPERRALQGVGALVASLPVVLVGIVLVKAAVGPLILAVASVVGEATGTYSGIPAVVLLVVGLATIGLGTWGIPHAVRVLDERITGKPHVRVHLGVSAVLVVLVLLMVAWPIGVPVVLGSLAVVAVAFSVLSLLFAELQHFSEVRMPPHGLTLLGFKRTPVFLLLAAWLTIASMFPRSAASTTSGTTRSRTPLRTPPLRQIRQGVRPRRSRWRCHS